MTSTGIIANASKLLVDLTIQFFIYLMAFFAFVAAIEIDYSYGMAPVVSSFIAIKSFSFRLPTPHKPKNQSKASKSSDGSQYAEYSPQIDDTSILKASVPIKDIDEELAHSLFEMYEEDQVKILDWLSSPKASLDGLSPIQAIIDKEKLKVVKNHLVQSNHGMLA